MISLSPEDIQAIRLSLQVAAAATLIGLPFGIGAAYLLVFVRFPGKSIFEGIINLPLVLPPVVVGYLLLLLFKKHPQAASARNVIHCTIRNTYETEWLIGVELDCRGNRLIAEVVPRSVEELDIRPGKEIIAVFKASAFRKLF